MRVILTRLSDRLRSQAPHGQLLDAGLVLLMAVLLWITIVANLVSIRTETERDAVRDTRNLVHIFQDNIGRTIGSIDRAIQLLRAAYARDPAHFDLASWARQIPLISSLVPRVAIIDTAGRVIAAGPGQPDPQPDRQPERGNRKPDDDVFAWPGLRALLQADGDDLIVRSAVGQSGRPVVLVARRILARDGHALGLAVASIDPSGLLHRYGSPETGEEELLVGGDGVVRASTENDGALAAGHSLADTGLPARAAAGAEGSYVSAGALTGVARIISFGWVASYKLIVVVTTGRDAILTPYRQVRDRYLGAGGVLTALLLLIGALLIGHKRQLLRSRAVLTDALENISQGIIMIDKDRRVPVINRRCIELLGLPPELLATDPTFDDLLRWQTASGEFDGTAEEFRRSVEMGGFPPVASVYERVRANGTALEVRTHMLPGGGAVRTFADITERRHAEARIRYLAHHDALTGLANRAAFDEQLAGAIAAAERAGGALAVLCLDLDRFKLVNDLHGHAAGDHLLMQVAGRMRDMLGTCGCMARTGGDEFTIVLTRPDRPGIGPESAMALAEGLIARLAAPYEIDGRVSRIGVSIGIALYPADGRTGEALLRNADVALYRAKEGGRNTFRFFEREMGAAQWERRRLEQDLREAVEQRQFHLLYQPVRDIRSWNIVGFEALLRWDHPLRGTFLASEFVPIAEEIGVMLQLGRWVLETACADAARWPAGLRLAINLSATQLRDPDLPALVHSVLDRASLSPSRLDLEITEASLADGNDAVLDTLAALRRQGVRMVLDDYGAGHAGFSLLWRYPFDRLKMDRSFIAVLGEEAQAHGIVAGVMALARNLRLDVVAEGVETERQLALLRDLACDHVQGFLAGHPVPRDELGPLFLDDADQRPCAAD